MTNVKPILQELSEVTLVAVTKNHTVDEINPLLEAGVKHIGENRWQEASEKIDEIPEEITKHFIGKLQTNKVKFVVPKFDVIQSVDSFKLAIKIDHEAEKIGKKMPIFIQVNISEEPQKSGVLPENLEALIAEVDTLDHLELQGLMAIVMNTEDPEERRDYFRKMKELQVKHGLKELSMGMSDDYKIAIEEGATMVRIGSLLFQ